ncbi:hypothetical protein, partial [Bacteroides heparinolyticus]|uniref:hypothetical protein n=2 Tax=Prevotella heparinolytica TaxID=28113 RepID=UPI0035A12A3C
KWLLLLKMRGWILSGGYFLNAPVYGDWGEESLSDRPPFPCLTAAILCRDRGKCSSRQTQVSDVTDTSV